MKHAGCVIDSDSIERQERSSATWYLSTPHGRSRVSQDPHDPDSPEDPPPIELPIDGVLDLHTFRPAEVAELVADYLDECRRRGILEIRIIHGKGKGALRRTVHSVLARRADELEFRLAPPERGGWGATLVTLRS
jgi:dsDNA-specific endonuclease/ATPase MutS2